jgi:trans-aconitate methyltransferase
MQDATKNQKWSADDYAENARFVPTLGAPVLKLLAPKAGEHILDLACGDGFLTQKIAESGAHVTGVDAAPDLVQSARARGLNIMQKDAQALDFSGEFDAVFSNAALHWMPDTAAVVDGVSRALNPGGRFVGELGGFGNVAAIVTGLMAAMEKFGMDGPARMPWFFPTDAAYRTLLENAGFVVKQIELIPRPTPLPTGMEGWLKTFAHPFLFDQDANTQAEILRTTVRLLKPSLCDEQDNWIADYVRLRFHAVKPQ